MDPSGLPPAIGRHTAAQTGGAVRRLAIFLAAVLAVAGVTVAVATLLLGPTTSWIVLGLVAGLMVGVVAGLGRTLYLLRSPGSAVGFRAREWDAGRGRVADRTSVDDQDLAQEIQARWRSAAEGAGLGRLVTAPGGYLIRVPVVERVEMRPFTKLTVRLWAEQRVDDIIAVQDQIRESMRAKGIRIELIGRDVIGVELWGGVHGPRLSIYELEFKSTPSAGRVPQHRALMRIRRKHALMKACKDPETAFAKTAHDLETMVLELDAGLGDATRVIAYHRLGDDVTGLLDLEAGLAAITDRAEPERGQRN